MDDTGSHIIVAPDLKKKSIFHFFHFFFKKINHWYRFPFFREMRQKSKKKWADNTLKLIILKQMQQTASL